jgi:hypothetical protein
MSLDPKTRWAEAYHCKVYWNLETGEVCIEPGTHIHEFPREPEPWENSDALQICKTWPNELTEDEYKALMSCKHSCKLPERG